MRKAVAVATREFKSLIRDRYVLLGVVIAPFLAFVVMGLIFSFAAREVSETVKTIGVGTLPESSILVLEDPSDELGLEVARLLKARVAYNLDNLEKALRDYRIVVVVHGSPTHSIASGVPVKVTIMFRSENPLRISDSIVLQSVRSLLETAFQAVIAPRYNVSLNLLLNPLDVEEKVYFENREVNPTLVYGLTLALGFLVFILGLTALQVGAMSIGVEREARTAEILLTLPLRRHELVAGKVAGVSAISMLALLSFIAGFLFYLYAVAPLLRVEIEGPEGQVVTIDLFKVVRGALEGIPGTVIPFGLLVLALTLVNATLTGLLVGLLFAGDVRGALTSTSYMTLVLVVPLFTEAYGLELPTLLKLLFLLTPFYSPFKSIQALILEDYTVSLAYMAATLAYLVLVLVASSLIMSGERLVYGFTLRIRR